MCVINRLLLWIHSNERVAVSPSANRCRESRLLEDVFPPSQTNSPLSSLSLSLCCASAYKIHEYAVAQQRRDNRVFFFPGESFRCGAEFLHTNRYCAAVGVQECPVNHPS